MDVSASDLHVDGSDLVVSTSDLDVLGSDVDVPESDLDVPSMYVHSSSAQHSGRSTIYSQVNNAHYNEWFDSWFVDTDNDMPPDECGWDAADDDNADWDIGEKEGPLHEDDVMWELIQRWEVLESRSAKIRKCKGQKVLGLGCVLWPPS